MYKTGTGVDGHSLHRHGVSDIWYKINHMSAFLLFFNFALKELHAHTVCFSLPPFLSLSLSAVSLSLIIGETISLSSPQVCVCFNKTMFPLWYYVHDCDTLWHKSFIMTHSLVYRLGYHEEMVSITLDNHKAIILLLLWYQCMNPHTCKSNMNFFFTWSSYFWGLPCSSVGKESAYNEGDPSSIPGWRWPLEKEMATHSNILAWVYSMDGGAWWLQSTGPQRVGHNWATSSFTSTSDVHC